MTIIFDLDHTLLDTEKFKDILGLSLKDSGVTSDQFWKAFEDTNKETRNVDFDPDKLIEQLRPVINCSREEAIAKIYSVIENIQNFLFPDALKVLEQLKNNGHRLVLFTHGNIDWQKKKVKQLGLEIMFEKLLFTNEEKEKMVTELELLKKPVVMINDNGKEMDEFQKVFPDFIMVAVRGPKPVPSDKNIPICNDLTEVAKVIDDL